MSEQDNSELRNIYANMRTANKFSDLRTSEQKYLSWSYVRRDVVSAVKFLCAEMKNVETTNVREFVVEVLTEKFNKLPEGTDFVNEKVGCIVVKTTLSEYKARKIEQLKNSSDSRNSGSTITRMLHNNRKELEKEGIKYEDGMWFLTG